MLQPSRDLQMSGFAGIGGQPVALAGVTLLAILVGIAAIASWRAYTGSSPELDRAVAARQLQQARAALASAQLVEKTKGLEVTQQESIDQLQAVQDELQTVRRELAAQQADTKRLSDQMSSLAEAVDGLRQSFASVQPAASDSGTAAVRKSADQRRMHRARSAQPASKTVKSHS